MGSQPGAGSGTPKWEMSSNRDSLTQTGTKTGAWSVNGVQRFRSA